MNKPRRDLITDSVKLRELLAAEKIIYEAIVMDEFGEMGNRRRYMNNVLYDQDYESYQGLSVLFDSTRAAGFIYHSFALIYKPNPRHQDVFAQLEIEPPDKLSHTEAGGIKIYGAHYVELNVTSDVTEDSNFTWYDWLREFGRRTNLVTHGSCTAPFEGELPL